MAGRLEQQRGQHRYDGQRQQQGSCQGEHDGQGYRDEKFSFQSLQRHQRQEYDDDDGDPCCHGRDDFFNGTVNDVQVRDMIAPDG